jgi:protein-disulfide isomerase
VTQAHPYALIAAEAAEAAALQGKFWEMHDLLYEKQAHLKPEIIPVWAKKIGLNLNKFGKDIKQGGVVEKRIQEDRQSGIRSGVNGTPTFYINGKRYDGSHDYDSLLGGLRILGATLRVKSADRVVPRIPKRTRRTTAYSERRGDGND